MIWSHRARLATALLVASTIAVGACASAHKGSRTAAAVEAHFPCRMNPSALGRFVEELPRESLTGTISVNLPRSTLGGVVGPGAVLEIALDRALVDGAPLAGGPLEARAASFEQWARAEWPNDTTGPKALYVAAEADVDIQTLRLFLRHVPERIALHLLVSTAAPSGDASDPGGDARSLAARILLERDPEVRKELAAQGYGAFSRCQALLDAVANAGAFPTRNRWPQLQERLAAALPTCDCADLDTDGLRTLIVAEQRAGTVSLGAIPATFLGDNRCGASMPMRSVGKLLGQLERFDAEFAGAYEEKEIAFDEVLTNERLLVYFCDALPGETLASLELRRETLFWRVPGNGTKSCEPWRFAPLAPGSPMGTWQRVTDDPSRALSLHYRQSAEEIRLFGPVPNSKSKPTDAGPWSCEQTYQLTGIDEHSIHYEGGGRWFYDAASCEAADDSTATRIHCQPPAETPPPTTEGPAVSGTPGPGDAAAQPAGSTAPNTAPAQGPQ